MVHNLEFRSIGMFIVCTECGNKYEAPINTAEYDRLLEAVKAAIGNDDWSALLCGRCCEEANGKV